MPKPLFLGVLFLAVTAEIHALDTVEPFDPGPSDFELYYGISEDRNQAFTTVFGMGVNRLVNPAISPEIYHDGTEFTAGLTLSNVMNLYSGLVELDLIPEVFTDFTTTTVGLGFEATVPMGVVTPYLQTLGTLAPDSDARDLLLAFGFMTALSPAAELFLEGGPRWTDSGSSVRVGAGLNYSLAENTELITEVTYEDQFASSLGIIQTF